MITDLGKFAAAHAKDYEVVAQVRDADGAMLDRALAIVQDFIISRGLILFGGQAIDSVLRLKGTQIYPDNQRPDFDFLSPRNVDDAYDLAELLHERGFVGVGAIRAIHVQTIKVRVDFRWVADVGHAPPAVFDSIPTFEYRGMRVVHPDFQRMDMHLAFCFPFSGSPREDIHHRWAKDLKRLNLLERHYPIHPAQPAQLPRPRGLSSTMIHGWTEARSGRPLLLGPDDVLASAAVAIHGFAAYALLQRELAAITATATPSLAIEFPDMSSVRVLQPCGNTIVVASPSPVELATGSYTRYDPYLDVRPESIQSGNLEVFSTEGRLLAAARVNVRLADGAAAVATVVSPQYLLLWFLLEAHRAVSVGVRNICREFYCHTLTILREAEAHYSRGELPGEEFAASPFAPTTATIGSVNNDNAYIIKVAESANAAAETPPPELGVPLAVLRSIRELPARGYFPGTGRPRPAFDYDKCTLFRRAGEPVPW